MIPPQPQVRKAASGFRLEYLAGAMFLGFLQAPAVEAQGACTAPGSSLELGARDLRVRPGDNFFRYAVGGWYERTTISADQSEAGVDVEVSNRVQSELRDLIERSSPVSKDPTEARIGSLYRSLMDEPRVQTLDDEPLQPDLRAISSIGSKREFLDLMASSYSGFGASFFSLLVAPDAKQPTNALILGQDGLGLPDRDYYLASEFREQRQQYAQYIAQTLKMAGHANPVRAAHTTIELETRIAQASWAHTRTRDVRATYNPMSLSRLQAYAPGIDWRRFLEHAGAGNVEEVVVSEPTAIRDLAKLFATTPLNVLKAWEMFRTVDGASPYLSGRFVDSRFAFRGRVLSGIRTMRPRWKRGVALVDADLGQALGRMYVNTYFPPAAKQQAMTLVERLKSAMMTRIEGSAWMGASTKREALEKLRGMKVFIGYPDQWRDYTGLRLDSQDLYGNVARSTAFDWAYQMSMAGKPLDPSAWGPFYWGIQPQTVDAFDIASENKIIFPAAILQPPYFDPRCDAAANYGAIGGIIGHEITHGFDDQGRKVDAAGKLRDWWTPQDEARFTAEADKLARQFDAFEVLPGVHLNGHQVLGENIADLGGLLLALDAYHASLAGAESPVIEGLSGDQRVFLGWASRWRRKVRDDALKQMAVSDVHSPAEFRVSGPVRNIDAWYVAFKVQPSDRLYLKPEDRARIW